MAYESCLRNYRIKDAARIARYYRPQKLYKYFDFSSQYWRKNVYEGQIAFNYPSNFNDPLDSRWFLDYKTIYKERLRDINEEWSVEAFGGEAFFENCIALNEEDLSYLRYMFCLSCFSETPHSNLMWGHYANKHTGFCLEYDLTRIPPTAQLIMPVVYTKAPFDASMILDMRNIGEKFAVLCPLLFKSNDWSYEKEWRIIIPDNDYSIPHVITLDNAISGVYFGFRSYGSERDELEMWAESKGIPAYQVERSYMSFDFKSELIEDIRKNKTHSGLVI